MAYDEEDYETVSIDGVKCVAVNPKNGSILCTHDDWDHRVWIGQKQVSEDSEVWKKGDEGKLVIPKWLARKENMV